MFNNEDQPQPKQTLQFLKYFDGKYYVSYNDLVSWLNEKSDTIQSFNDTEKMAYLDIREGLEGCYNTIKGEEIIKEIELDSMQPTNPTFSTDNLKEIFNKKGLKFPNNNFQDDTCYYFDENGYKRNDLPHTKNEEDNKDD